MEWTKILGWAYQHQGLVGLAAATILVAVVIVATIVGGKVVEFFFTRLLPHKKDYIDQLADAKDRAALKVELSTRRSALDLYLYGVVMVRAWLERLFGLPASRRAFSKCLNFAILYPSVLFMIAWIFGASGNVGQIIVLPEIDFQKRILFVIFFVVSTTFFYWIIRFDVIKNNILVNVNLQKLNLYKKIFYYLK